MSARCILCESEAFDPFCPGIVRCRNCTLVFADTHLTDEELLDLYGREYFFGEEYGDYIADRRVHERNFLLRLKVLDRFLNPSRHRSLFEIGSAYGFFLRLARPKFERVSGIDVTGEGTRFAREQFGLEVVQGEFLDQVLDGRPLDVVCMWDVMEHLRAPHLYVERISAHSTPGSLIALTTGDIDSLNARVRKGKWRLIHPPTHLYYFSSRTITALLAKYGYEIVYNRYCGMHRSLRNIFWTLFVLKGEAPRLYGVLEKTGLLKSSVYLNLFDIRYVVARKRAV